MNRRYYEYKFKTWQRIVFWTDTITLISVCGVGVGLWLIPSKTKADMVYKILALLATACSAFQLLKRPAEISAACEAYVAVYEQLDNGNHIARAQSHHHHLLLHPNWILAKYLHQEIGRALILRPLPRDRLMAVREYRN
jgi:hypothetical protein